MMEFDRPNDWIVVSRRFLNLDGSATEPAYAFTSNPSSGLYLKATDVLGWAIGGVEAMSLGNVLRVGVGAASPILSPVATQASPAFSFDGHTGLGMYFLGTDTVGIATGSNRRRLSVGPNEVIVGNAVNDGQALMHNATGIPTPSYAFVGDTGMGMYRAGAGRIGWSLGNTGRMHIDIDEFRCQPIWDNVIAASGAVNVNSGGIIYRSSSARKYKRDFAPLNDPFDVIRALNPVAFTSVIPVNEGERFIGFVAEEVAEVLPEAAEEENYDLRAVVAYLVAAVQELAPVEV
jgi:hypothetical protein